MIFACLGTQEFQFNRLLEKIDELVAKRLINEDVFAQVGYSTYRPSGYRFVEFLNFDEFDNLLENCSYVITHGGTGTIIKAIRKGKKVIAVPRLKKYGEHVDDHQKEIIEAFSEKNLILGIDSTDELGDAVSHMGDFTPEHFVSGNARIISIIESFIKKCM